MMKKVFIDGSAGTTGLRISERLNQRQDVQLLRLPEEYRNKAKDFGDAFGTIDAMQGDEVPGEEEYNKAVQTLSGMQGKREEILNGPENGMLI